MTKDKVLKTAFCLYSEGYFEVHSPFLPYTVGAGETEQEAMQEFTRQVEDWAREWESKGGPPVPQRKPVQVGLSIEAETVLNRIMREYDCAVDEALDILAARYAHMVLPKAT